MNSTVLGLRVASVLLGVVCIAHLIRIVANIALRIGTHDVGRWPSLVAALVSAALSAWLWSLAHHAGKPTSPPS